MRILRAMSLAIVVITVMVTTAFSQSTFLVEYYGDPRLFPNKIIPSFDGKHTIAFGDTFSNKIVPFFLKMNDSGAFSAGRLFQFEEELFRISATAATSDNGYIVAGVIGDFEKLSLVILKLTSNGSLSWKKKFPAAGFNEWMGNILEVKDGFLLTGFRYLHGLADANLLIVKIDKEGNLVWKRGFDTSESRFGLSGLGAYNLGLEGIFICGVIGNEHLNGNDLLILKINSLGKLVWSRKYSIAGLNFGGVGIITRTPDAGLLVASRVTTKQAVFGVSVLKTDSSGNLISSKIFTTKNNELRLYAASPTSDGALALAGAVRRDAGQVNTSPFVIKLDQTGNIQWKRSFRYPRSRFTGITAFSDGTIGAAGQTFAIYTATAFFVRLSANGDVSKGCGFYSSFPVDSTNIQVRSDSISLRPFRLSAPAAEVLIQSVNFEQSANEACGGTHHPSLFLNRP